jgi:hypothetical protein
VCLCLSLYTFPNAFVQSLKNTDEDWVTQWMAVYSYLPAGLYSSASILPTQNVPDHEQLLTSVPTVKVNKTPCSCPLAVSKAGYEGTFRIR